MLKSWMSIAVLVVLVSPVGAEELPWIRVAADNAGFELGDTGHPFVPWAAVRKHDWRHLITVGLVPWSLECPGLTTGFVPSKIADDLDFIVVHLYPEEGRIADAIDTLKGFRAVGKPVMIEETFTLKCGAKELEQFVNRVRTRCGDATSTVVDSRRFL